MVEVIQLGALPVATQPAGNAGATTPSKFSVKIVSVHGKAVGDGVALGVGAGVPGVGVAVGVGVGVVGPGVGVGAQALAYWTVSMPM